MNAGHLHIKYGDLLLGKQIMTERYGGYPGGVATIIEILPDPQGAPEIIFQVRHPTWRDSDGEDTIGVFKWEEVSIVHKDPDTGSNDDMLACLDVILKAYKGDGVNSI